MGKQSRIIEVPKIACQKSVEAVKSIPQERSSERTCEQSEVIKVTSSEDQLWQRTVEQNLDDTWHEPASRFFVRIRERMEKVEKEEGPSIFVTI